MSTTNLLLAFNTCYTCRTYTNCTCNFPKLGDIST